MASFTQKTKQIITLSIIVPLNMPAKLGREII